MPWLVVVPRFNIRFSKVGDSESIPLAGSNPAFCVSWRGLLSMSTNGHRAWMAMVDVGVTRSMLSRRQSVVASRSPVG